jgi:hypothetical protein
MHVQDLREMTTVTRRDNPVVAAAAPPGQAFPCGVARSTVDSRIPSDQLSRISTPAAMMAI